MDFGTYLLLLWLHSAFLCSYCQNCKVGYTGRRGKCNDINECAEAVKHCGENTTCFNTKGSYYCQCKPGFSFKSINFTVVDGQCEDINECEELDMCGQDTQCFNTIGSYYCECKPGFSSSINAERFQNTHNATCEDIDECSTDASLCGVGGTCQNEMGSYRCACSRGFYNYGYTKAPCVDLNCDQYKLDNEIKQTLPELREMMSLFRNNCLSLNAETSTAGMSASAETLLEKLLSIVDELLLGRPLDNNEKVSTLLTMVEKAVHMISLLLTEPRTQMESAHTEVEILVNRSTVSPQGPVSLSSQYASLDTHWETAAGIDIYQGFAYTCLLTYKDLEASTNDFFHGMSNTSQRTKYQITSKVVMASVSSLDTHHLQEPVTLHFTHTESREKGMSVCVYWDPSLQGGGWSKEGCTTLSSQSNKTICSCNHLSSFAVLMALYDIEDPFELQLITWVGLTLSLVCLLLCIITFAFCRSIQGTRNTIHLHLCISLFIGNLVFLAGISRTENKGACAFVAGLLHFFYLSAFCWMFLEGVQLYRMVVLVFNTNLRPRYLLATGYGVPAVIVAISAIVNVKGYGTDRHCWLSLKDNFIWSFFGPVCVIIVMNIFFFIITVWKLSEKFSSLNPDLSNLRKIKTFTATAIAQLCILGTMWIFGGFQFEKDTLVMSYLFTILSSMQGVLMFVMHCLCSKQVREEYGRFLTSICRMQKYTEFSSNPSSNSQAFKSSHTRESKI